MRPMVLGGLVVLASCAAGGSSSTVESRGLDDPSVLADYAQLRVGSRRTYAVTFPGQTGREVVTITGEEDGFVVDDRGGRFKLDGHGLRDPQRYLVRYPLSPGTEWKSVVSASAVERYRILSVGESCSVRAGWFEDCLVVEGTIRGNERVTLVARWTWIRGVGLGQVETVALVDGARRPQTKQDLLHYALDGEPDGSGEPAWGR